MPYLDTAAQRLNFVRDYARDFGLQPELVAAVCEQESDWEPGAVRFEPAFLRKYVAQQNLALLEALDRSTSWGLMQIMGQTAWEFGFRGAFPTLRVPEFGVEFGCRKLQKCMAAMNGDVVEALSRYNGGANLSYAKEVLARLKNYTTLISPPQTITT